MTKTLSPPSLASLLEPVPATWGFYDCQRDATAAELAATNNHCAECGVTLVDKYGSLHGTVIGRRGGRDEAFVFCGALCRKCDIAHSIADGF